jgi:glucose/mannose-6-phosphate isomerase
MFMFFESVYYNQRNQKRFQVTQEVLKKNKIQSVICPLQSKSKLLQVFEMLIFGSYVSYYLGLLNSINPAPTPYVHYFKKRMK